MIKYYSASKLRLIFAIFLINALVACGGSNNSTYSGSLSLGITDGPIEIADVVSVSFTAVEVHGPETILFEFEEAQTINLLDYQGNERLMLLDGEELPTGNYQWLRLIVNDDASYIEIEGEQYPLLIPSGAETGLKLNQNFVVASGATSDFTIDFDLRKSIHQEGNGDYTLRPTLRIVNNLEAGSITGTIDSDLIFSQDCHNGDNNDIGNMIYLYDQGIISFFQDFQGNANDPIATSPVIYNEVSGDYEYTLGFIAPGVDVYMVAFTCDALLDVNSEDNSDDMYFYAYAPVTVTAGTTTVVDIPYF